MTPFSRGVIVRDRPKGGLTEHKLHFAQLHEPIDTLAEAVRKVRPNVLIGAAAQGGAFNQEILELMADINETPIIFALSNPTSKAECTAEEAYTHTKGRCIFASGSPFAPVTYNNRKYYPRGACSGVYESTISRGKLFHHPTFVCFVWFYNHSMGRSGHSN